MLEYKENGVEIKSVGTRKIQGTGIRFGSETDLDFDREWFYKETETGLINGANRPFLLEHGFSSKFSSNKLGDTVYEQKDEGWEYETHFLETEIGDKAYNEVISHPYRSSAGAASHTRRATLIKGTSRLDIWLVAEQSATLSPADPNNPRVTRTKSDFILFQVSEMLKEHRADLGQMFEDYVTKTNDARQNLADALMGLRRSFASGEKFVINEEILASLEQVAQPIAILSLDRSI